jgi:hypothetical protein
VLDVEPVEAAGSVLELDAVEAPPEEVESVESAASEHANKRQRAEQRSIWFMTTITPGGNESQRGSAKEQGWVT